MENITPKKGNYKNTCDMILTVIYYMSNNKQVNFNILPFLSI